MYSNPSVGVQGSRAASRSRFATSFDIATGYFDIGALLALDGFWQRLEMIRILMGAEVMAPTRALLLKSVRERAVAKLDESLEADKDKNPFLTGVDAILAALASGQIECRVYDKDKFHAKAYITHAKSAVIGSQATATGEREVLGLDVGDSEDGVHIVWLISHHSRGPRPLLPRLDESDMRLRASGFPVLVATPPVRRVATGSMGPTFRKHR